MRGEMRRETFTNKIFLKIYESKKSRIPVSKQATKSKQKRTRKKTKNKTKHNKVVEINDDVMEIYTESADKQGVSIIGCLLVKSLIAVRSNPKIEDLVFPYPFLSALLSYLSYIPLPSLSLPHLRFVSPPHVNSFLIIIHFRISAIYLRFHLK